MDEIKGFIALMVFAQYLCGSHRLVCYLKDRQIKLCHENLSSFYERE
jgi:hypothetical protein